MTMERMRAAVTFLEAEAGEQGVNMPGRPPGMTASHGQKQARSPWVAIGRLAWHVPIRSDHRRVDGE
jgi:hypothetical protein